MQLPTLGTCSTMTKLFKLLEEQLSLHTNTAIFIFLQSIFLSSVQIDPVCQKPIFVQKHFWRDEEKILKKFRHVCALFVHHTGAHCQCEYVHQVITEVPDLKDVCEPSSSAKTKQNTLMHYKNHATQTCICWIWNCLATIACSFLS